MKENISNIDKSVNERLKFLREVLDLTQSDFSKILEVKQSYYSDIENSKREVTSKLIKNLVTIFRFSADWILTGEGNYRITNVDNPIEEKEWNVHDSINSTLEPGMNKNSSTMPFYLDLHIDKKLIIDFIKMDNDVGKLYNGISTLTTFSIIIENLERAYFEKIRTAEKNRDKYYRGHKFNYEDFKESVISEVKNLMHFKPALEKINDAIEQFYKDIEPLDNEEVIDGFFGRKQRESEIYSNKDI